MQDQLVCNGCRSMLMFPRGATNVCCALCRTINIAPLPPPQGAGMDMAHIICGGCRTMLAYTRGASSVRCSCCQSLNLVSASSSNQNAHINCGNCRTTLMYPYGASSVKCALCQYITNANIGNGGRVPTPMNRPNFTASAPEMPSATTTQTVVVENPMSVDERGKLVSNVVVGVTTDKR